MHLQKRKKIVELGMSFWAGIGLMSIINIWKISESQHAVTYSRIMFGFSILFMVICLFYLIKAARQNRE